MWKNLNEFAERLRERGFSVELSQSKDENYERYVIVIEKDLTNKGDYIT